MKPVFADTSYYLALVNSQDALHERAKELSEVILGRVFVTEYVVELGSALARGSDRTAYLDTLKQIQAEDAAVVIPASPALFREGVALFSKRLDKNWSVVDCISFVVMKKRKLKDARTTDHHFEQADFRALLRD